jgi:hypothetical protein
LHGKSPKNVADFREKNSFACDSGTIWGICIELPTVDAIANTWAKYSFKDIFCD